MEDLAGIFGVKGKRVKMGKFAEIQGATEGLSEHKFFIGSEAFWMETTVKIFLNATNIQRLQG